MVGGEHLHLGDGDTMEPESGVSGLPGMWTVELPPGLGAHDVPIRFPKLCPGSTVSSSGGRGVWCEGLRGTGPPTRRTGHSVSRLAISRQSQEDAAENKRYRVRDTDVIQSLGLRSGRQLIWVYPKPSPKQQRSPGPLGPQGSPAKCV